MHNLLNLKSDVSVGLYPVRWYENKSICLTNSGIKELKDLTNNDKIIIAGFDCCLLKNNCFNVSVERLYIEIDNHWFDGEDFGWFKKIYEKGIIIRALNKEIKHII